MYTVIKTRSSSYQAIKYNIHCFLEKPLGSSSKQLSELENILKRIKNK